MLHRLLLGFLVHASLRRLLLILAVVLAIRDLVWAPVLITGRSMLPTLRNGQLAVVNKLAYLRKAPRRGDIVAVWTGKELMIKRIIAVAGDEIAARDGMFYINGAPLQEPYVQDHDHWNIAPGTIAPEQLVIAGDNRSQTLIAVVAKGRIVGRLLR